jgi:hypothetical protein
MSKQFGYYLCVGDPDNVFDKRATPVCEWRTQYPFLGFQGQYNNHFIKKTLINYPN